MDIKKTEDFPKKDIKLTKDVTSIQINLGKVCNNNCIFCMSKSPEIIHEFAKFRELEKDIIHSATLGYKKIDFVGGEPTIHPDIIHLVNLAKNKGFEDIHLISNGRKYSDLEFLNNLVIAGANIFSVSIHSHIESIEDFLTQREGGFKEKIQGIKNLIKLKKEKRIKKIAINILITKKNYKKLHKTLEFFKNIGINEFAINSMNPNHGNSKINIKTLLPKYSEIIPSIKRIKEIEGITVTLNDFPVCASKGFFDPFDFSKMIAELSSNHFPRIIAYTLNQKSEEKEFFDWKTKKINECKIKPEKCKNCCFNKGCEGIWKGYYETLGDIELSPIYLTSEGEINKIEKSKISEERINILTSNVCNNNCIFCMEDKRIRERKQFDFDELKKSIDRAKNEKIKKILFTGNEPTMNNYLPEAIKYAKECGFEEISIVTNGRRLFYMPYLLHLVDSGLNRINVSFHGSKEKIQNALTRTPGSFKQTLGGLKNIKILRKKFELKLNINITLTKSNIQDIKKILKLVLKFKPDNIIINPVIPVGRASENFNAVIPRYSNIAETLRPIFDAFPENRIKVNGLVPCLFPNHLKNLGERETNIIPAPGKPIRIIPSSGKTKGILCAFCKKNSSCEGIWKGYSDKFGFKEFNPILEQDKNNTQFSFKKTNDAIGGNFDKD